MIPVKIVKNDPNALIPAKATEGAAGLDLYSIEKMEVKSGECAMVDTGLSVQIPVGYAGFILPRSGLALKKGLTVLNAPGLIDSDYRGRIRVLLYGTGLHDEEVCAGDRIAQLVIMKVEEAKFALVGALDPTDRGDGGFGSSGA